MHPNYLIDNEAKGTFGGLLALFFIGIGTMLLASLITVFFLDISVEKMTYQDNFEYDVFLVGISSFILAFPVIWLLVKPFLRESPFFFLSTSKRFSTKLFLKYGLIWLFLSLIITYIFSFFFEMGEFISNEIHVSEYLLFCAIALIACFIQTGFEEYFFRGLIQGVIINKLKKPWVGIFISSFIFMLLHSFNPEIQVYGSLIFVYYFVMGIILGMVTYKTQGIVVSWGIHFFSNLIGYIFINYKGAAIKTQSLFTATEVNVPQSLFETIIVGTIFLWILFKTRITNSIR